MDPCDMQRTPIQFWASLISPYIFKGDGKGNQEQSIHAEPHHFCEINRPDGYNFFSWELIVRCSPDMEKEFLMAPINVQYMEAPYFL